MSRGAAADDAFAPALPTSDLERLEEAQPGERPAVAAPSTTPAPPTTGVLLLGCLAVLSLFGVRLRLPSEERT